MRRVGQGVWVRAQGEIQAHRERGTSTAHHVIDTRFEPPLLKRYKYNLHLDLDLSQGIL